MGSVLGRVSVILALVVSQFAGAWGHFEYLSTSPTWAGSSLVVKIRKNHRIRYCLDNHSTFSTNSQLGPQVETALGLWLEAAADLGGRVPVQQTGCSPGNFDLMVSLGPETTYPGLGAYNQAWSASGYYMQTKIDTGYTYQNGGRTFRFQDITAILGFSALAENLRSISITQPQTVYSLARQKGTDYISVYWTTYRVMLHEFGHAFGLCDTYDSQVQHCDRVYGTATHPSSVMKDSTYFYLTQDDIDGVRSLFRRFYQ